MTLYSSGYVSGGIAWSNKGDRVLVGVRNRLVLFDAVTGELITSFGSDTGDRDATSFPEDFVRCVSFGSDDQEIFSGHEDCKIRVWNSTNGELVRTVLTSAPVQQLGLSRNNQRIAAATCKVLGRNPRKPGVHEVVIFDLESGKEERKLVGHKTPFTCVNFNPNGNLVAAASANWGPLSNAKIWDVATGETVRDIPNVNRISFRARFDLE